MIKTCDNCGCAFETRASRPNKHCSMACLVDFDQKWMPEPNSGCWLWLRATNPEGYGMVGVGRKVWLAHRYSYVRAGGIIPDGLQLDHLCRVRCCVNPTHLEPVTNCENSIRTPRIQAARLATHCAAGHPLTDENVYRYNGGARRCRTCTLSSQKIAKQRRRDHARLA